MTTLNWTWKKFFLVGVFAGATFAVCWTIGNAITLAIGPGMSGIATIIITTILVVICARLVDARFVFTILVGLFTFFAWFTNMFGPPGPQKIIIGILTGLVYDGVWELTRRKPSFLPLAAAVSTAVSILLIYALMVFMNYPKKDYLASLLIYLCILYAALGAFGAIIGNWIFDHNLKGISIIEQLKS